MLTELAIITACAGALVLCSSPASGQDAGPGKKLADQRIARMTDPAAMQAWMDSMKPGLGHEWVAQMVGDWDVTMKMWMDPSAPPTESKATSTFEPALNGKFAFQRLKGEMMGMPYEGMGMYGFDNNRQLFITSWADNMNGTISVMKGSLDRTGTVLTQIGEMDEPMSGEMGKPFMGRTTIQGPDTMVFEVYEILYGEAFKVMQFEYTRRKG